MNKGLKDIGIYNVILVFIQILTFNSQVFSQIDGTWNKTFGTELYDDAKKIVTTSDNGYIFVGTSADTSSKSYDMFLIRTDSVGETIWTKRIGGNDWDEGRALLKVNKDEYLAAGEFSTNNRNVWVTKFNENGDIFWEAIFETDSMETVSSIVSSGDSSFVVVGSTEYLYPNSDYFVSELLLMKIDSLGNQVWLKYYVRDSFSEVFGDRGKDVKQTIDGGFIIVAESSRSIWLLKTDAVGDTLWTKLFYKEDFWHRAHSIHQTVDGGYIIGGMAKHYGDNGSYAWIIKTNASGDIIWDRLYAGGWANALILLEDSSLVLTGNISSDIWLVKINAQGDIIWTKSFGGNHNDMGNDVVQSSDGGFAVAGYTISFGAGSFDAWLVKTDSFGNVAVTVDESIASNIPTEFTLMPNFPNPFNPVTNISYALPIDSDVSLIIYNLRGQEVARLIDGEQLAGNHSITWNASNVSSGIYFYRLQAGDFVQTRKMVLLK